MSFNSPICCGFIKCLIYEQQSSDSNLSDQYKVVKKFFPDINLSENAYKLRAKFLTAKIRSLGKKFPSKKQQFCSTFSGESWSNLIPGVKAKHGSFECQGCLGNEKYREPLSFLRIDKSDITGQRIAEEKGLFVPVRLKLIEETEKDIKILNAKYKENFSMTFNSALKATNKAAAKQARSEIAKELKEDIEEQWKETAVVRLTSLFQSASVSFNNYSHSLTAFFKLASFQSSSRFFINVFYSRGKSPPKSVEDRKIFGIFKFFGIFQDL